MPSSVAVVFCNSVFMELKPHCVLLLVMRMKMQRMMQDRAIHTPAMMPVMDFSSMWYRPSINAAEMV